MRFWGLDSVAWQPTPNDTQFPVNVVGAAPNDGVAYREQRSYKFVFVSLQSVQLIDVRTNFSANPALTILDEALSMLSR